MVIGVPREPHHHEHRVGLTPWLTRRLTTLGHTILVEKDAGLAAHFSDEDFQRAGGQTVYSTEEVYMRADLVCRVSTLSAEEMQYLKPELIICGFHHLAVAPKEKVETFMKHKITLIGYEIIQDEKGGLPVLFPMSEMGGQMAIHIAAQFLQNEARGRGVLLGHVPGVAPPTVLVLGAGVVGHAAARQAVAAGAHVIVVDVDPLRLTDLHREFGGQVVTMAAGLGRLERLTAIADVVIGAVYVPGERAPFLITERMVKGMKEGSVIIDMAIDQGGCVETSRPTSLPDPTFVAHGVVHYCVPNMTANIARTASRALANASVAYLSKLADLGPAEAIRQDSGLAQGVYLFEGNLVNKSAADALKVPVASMASLLEEGKGV